MAEQNDNLWAPWRMEYIESLGPEDDGGCFLCKYWASPSDDVSNHVLWRTERVLVVMNRFPYTNGHLLIAPGAHGGDLAAIDDELLTSLAVAMRQCVGLLGEVVGAHGYNIGSNLGRCAGAGLPDHVHAHIVPRWNGDTNFMAVLGGVRVIPQALDALRDRLRARAAELGYPSRSDG